MRTLIVLLVLILGGPAEADGLSRHFFDKDKPDCLAFRSPVVIMADLTVTGEIDDSITLIRYRELEAVACVKVLAVVSIFGNGQSTTAEIHHNLQVRLSELGLQVWQEKLLRGPDESYLKALARKTETATDKEWLWEIASVINASPKPVSLVELGPFTVSARLLAGGMVRPKQIRQIIGVGGRALGESFAPGGNLIGSIASFTDFNVRIDTAAVDYLVRYHSKKMRVVTYRTGIGKRMVPVGVLSESLPILAEHAKERTRFLRRIGYPDGLIPSWDTWTTAFFQKNGPDKLGCQPTRVRMIAEGRSMRLILDHPRGFTVIACHEVLR